MAGETPVLGNAAKIIGEAVLPGASLVMEGQVATGLLHTVAAVVGGALLGPIGVILVAANSYSSSVRGEGLLSSAKADFFGGTASPRTSPRAS
jgi:hypothetical protein